MLKEGGRGTNSSEAVLTWALSFSHAAGGRGGAQKVPPL